MTIVTADPLQLASFEKVFTFGDCVWSTSLTASPTQGEKSAPRVPIKKSKKRKAECNRKSRKGTNKNFVKKLFLQIWTNKVLAILYALLDCGDHYLV